MSEFGYGQFAYSYDSLTQNIDYQKRGAYFHEIMLQQGKTKGILVDLACGTGSLSEYFARLDYEVIGVDASEEMLQMAQEKKLENGSDVLYLCQPMQELDLYGTVDIVLCALDSLNHVTERETVQQIFQRVSLFLNEDGLFVFDVNTVYKHQHVLANQTFVYDLDDIYCVWQNQLEQDNLVHITLDLFEYDPDGDCYDRYQEEFKERAYSHEQLKGMLDAADMDIVAVYGDDTFELPAETTQRAIYVCKNRFCKNRKAE
ncbi:class I SAM-dependent DNA methyltransferase [Massiliimalia massiliensis]|uniref:class I SAM-dependent DNA methyltransferase n=1 Tax=Massiliimalia massiliensis TaxID=1852384 RepID=UPI000985E7D0|nr:class I SAM-dependent methyltransferase [Massiliimalia massiliensis]